MLFALVLTVCDTMMASANDPQIPADEIWYTTIDGQVLNPYITDAFGATISSNTYKNGKGIIKFDRLVTNIGNKAFWYCSTLNSITIPNSRDNPL